MSKKKELDPRIRDAVCARYGGFENATVAQIMSTWLLIDPAVRKEILTKKKGDANAGGTRSK